MNVGDKVKRTSLLLDFGIDGYDELYVVAEVCHEYIRLKGKDHYELASGYEVLYKNGE